MKVGDIVHIKCVQDNELVERPITKIGTKYVYVNINIRNRSARFYKDTLKWGRRSYPLYVMYLSLADMHAREAAKAYDNAYEEAKAYSKACQLRENG